MITIYRFVLTFTIKLAFVLLLFPTNVIAQKDSSKVQLPNDTFVETNPIILDWQEDWEDLSGIKETKNVYNRFVKTYHIWVLTNLEGKKATFKNYTIIFKKYHFIGHTSGSTFMIRGVKHILINNFEEKWYKKLGSFSFAVRYTDIIDIPPPGSTE